MACVLRLAISHEDLSAFVDDELNAIDAVCVGNAVGSDFERAQIVAIYREQNLALRALFSEIAAEPVPPKMRALFERFDSGQAVPETLGRPENSIHLGSC